MKIFDPDPTTPGGKVNRNLNASAPVLIITILNAISEKRSQPVRAIGFFSTHVVFNIFNLPHLLLDLAPRVACLQ
jgi:hypothetical protein